MDIKYIFFFSLLPINLGLKSTILGEKIILRCNLSDKVSWRVLKNSNYRPTLTCSNRWGLSPLICCQPLIIALLLLPGFIVYIFHPFKLLLPTSKRHINLWNNHCYWIARRLQDSFSNLFSECKENSCC